MLGTFEVVAIVVGGTVTAISSVSLWLVSVIDKRERGDDPAEPRVHPWHDANGPCVLCGNPYYVSPKAKGVRLYWNCAKCGGSYETKTRR
jgi:hypothetical protein